MVIAACLEVDKTMAQGRLAKVTVVIVNFKTHKLTQRCYESLQRVYPTIKTILIDNGSHDASTAHMKALLKNQEAHLRIKFLTSNVGHGPALHWGFQMADTEFVFALDSDCLVRCAGAIEGMVSRLQQKPLTYAIGWLRWVNFDGVAAAKGASHKGLSPYVHPAMSLYRRAMYYTLPPFVNSGAPAIFNMRYAHQRGLQVEDFPVKDYITHLIAGTRRMFGGRWNPKKNEKPRAWDAKQTYPI